MINRLDVEIVELPTTPVISVSAVGPEPETKAWNKLKYWLVNRNFEIDNLTIFGFDRPNLTGEEPEYGYEFWVPFEKPIKPDETIEIKEMKGGIFARTRCEVNGNFMNITKAWKKLVGWVNSHDNYNFNSDECFEHHLDPDADPEDFVLDLYLPIIKSESQ